MSTLINFFSYLVSFLSLIFIFLFIFWARLKDDYDSKKLFSAGFYIVSFIYLAFFINKFFIFPHLTRNFMFNPSGSWFWFMFLSILISLSFIIIKYKFKLFETVDVLVFGILTASMPIEAYFLIITKNFLFLYQLLFLISLVTLYLILNTRYKKLAWYRSGRVGFSGLLTLGIFFLVKSIVAVFIPDMLFLAGKLDIVLSAAASFLSFFALYNLGSSS
jgi:hypothetical protein